MTKPAYELDAAALAYLSRKGERIVRRAHTHNFNHAKLATHITTSIEVGIKNAPNARLSWGEIHGPP